jgi:hypothetical protein
LKSKSRKPNEKHYLVCTKLADISHVALQLCFGRISVVGLRRAEKRRWGAPSQEARKSNLSGGGENFNGGSGSSVVFTGQVAIAMGLVDQAADRVLPIPLNRSGEPTVTSLKSVDIGSNGEFEMKIDNGPGREDWIFLLIDDDASKKMDQIRGFIGLSAAGDDLIRIPVADAKKDSAIDLGTISSPTKDVAKASATIDQKSAELNVKTDYLQEMASVDGVLRGIKNDWANYNEKTGVYYTTAPFFNWYINLNGVPSDSTDPASFTHTGCGIYFSTNDPRITLDALCSPSSDSKHRRLEIIPPMDVVDGNNVTYNANNTMSNSAVNGIQASGKGFDCGAGTFYANGSSPTGGAGFNVGVGGFPQAMPNGV